MLHTTLVLGDSTREPEVNVFGDEPVGCVFIDGLTISSLDTAKMRQLGYALCEAASKMDALVAEKVAS